VQDSFGIVKALAGLGNRSDAWQFIRDFTAEWADPIRDGDGSTRADLDDAERRLGVRLPAAVREAYLLLGRRPDLTSVNGTLLTPDMLDYDPDNQVLVFRAAHQGVALFGVSLTDPADDDPPVLYCASLMDKDRERWEPFFDRFSLACVDMLLWEAVEAGPLSDGRTAQPAEIASLVDGLTRVPFPVYPPGFDTAVWYASDDLVLRDIDGDWVSVRARTKQALDRFRLDHPGRWVNQ
jgi:hypothetical protein